MTTEWTSAIEGEGDERRQTCEACAESTCSVCGHQPCPVCLDDCDHTDCLVAGPDTPGGGGDPTELKKNHACVFTPCPKHKVN